VVGFAAIAKAALDARDAANELSRAMNAAAGTEANAKKKYGVGSEQLRWIRVAIQKEDKDALERLSKRYPEAVEKVRAELDAAAKRNVGGQDDVPKPDPDEDAIAIAKENEKALAEEREKWTEKYDALREKQFDLELREEQDLADEKKRIAEEAAQAKIDAWKKEQDKRKELAKKTIAEILAEQKAEEKRTEERETDAKKAARLKAKEARGIRLAPKDAKWLAAFGERKMAVDLAKGGEVAIAEAEKQLAEMKNQNDNLRGIRTDLAQVHRDILAMMERG
jgi:hypothetical protein